MLCAARRVPAAFKCGLLGGLIGSGLCSFYPAPTRCARFFECAPALCQTFDEIFEKRPRVVARRMTITENQADSITSHTLNVGHRDGVINGAIDLLDCAVTLDLR